MENKNGNINDTQENTEDKDKILEFNNVTNTYSLLEDEQNLHEFSQDTSRTMSNSALKRILSSNVFAFLLFINPLFKIAMNFTDLNLPRDQYKRWERYSIIIMLILFLGITAFFPNKDIKGFLQLVSLLFLLWHVASYTEVDVSQLRKGKFIENFIKRNKNT